MSLRCRPRAVAVSAFAAWLLAGVPVVRGQGAGTADVSFQSVVTDIPPACLAVQADGRILLGGTLFNVNGAERHRMARLDPNGMLEGLATFDAGTSLLAFSMDCLALPPDGRYFAGGPFMLARRQENGALDSLFNPAITQFAPPPGNIEHVNCIALTSNNRILIAGAFTKVAGQPRNGITRLLPSGTLDLSFTSTASIAGDELSQIHSMAIQDDGRIIIAGKFTSVNGQPRKNIARLNSNGTLDDTFFNVPSAVGDGQDLVSVVVQPDGKIIVGGHFSSAGAGVSGVARLHADGSLDTLPPSSSGFAGTDAAVESMVLQADGKVIIAGRFTQVNGEPRSGIARLLPNMRVDPSFGAFSSPDPGAYSVALQADGKVLFAGGTSGPLHTDIRRFLNDAAVQTLDVPAKNRIVWMRSGAAPEVSQVTFEISTDGGVLWMGRSPVTRIPGGWEYADAMLPSRVMVRARGYTMGGGNHNASPGVVQSVASFDRGPGAPDIGLELPNGTAVPDNLNVDLGTAMMGTSLIRTANLRNNGDADLTVVRFEFDGPDAAAFTAQLQQSLVLTPGQSRFFAVRFLPARMGPFSASLRFFSNDPDASPFTINLSGNTEGTFTEIAVTRPDGTDLPDGGMLDFGVAGAGAAATRTCVIKNTGLTNLFGLEPQITGPDAGAFVITTAPSQPVAPGAATQITVRLVSTTPGRKTALLQMPCNDEDESTFDITLTGFVMPPGPAGMPDLNFGGTGEILTPSGGFSAHAAFGRAVAVQSDGRILVAGYVKSHGSNDYDLALWRFRADGRADTAFNGSGLATADFGSPDDLAYSLVIQPDGKILAAGEAGGDFAMARFLPDGTLDPAFNNGTGRVTTDFGPGARAAGVALQSDGRIILAGTGANLAATAHFGLARYHPNGNLDVSFGSEGRLFALIGPACTCTGVAVQPDGRIVAAGFSGPANSSDFAVIRLSANGQPDPAFGGGGVLTDFGEQAAGRALALQNDGKILVAGLAIPDFSDRFHFGFARYLPGGAPDFSFSATGTGRFTMHTGPGSNFAQSLVLQSDGKFLVSGDGTGNAGRVFRFLPDGNPDPFFHAPGTVIGDLVRASGLAVQADGKILLTGHTSTGQMSLQRFLGSSEPRPQLHIEEPAGTWIPPDGTAALGSVLDTSGKTLTLTIRNSGYAVLNIASFTVEGADAAKFTVTLPAPAALDPGGTVPLAIRFAPAGLGDRTAVLRIAGNDPDNSNFVIHLTGSGRAAVPGDAWRLTHFGTQENSGAAADLSDPDGDHQVNLVEFATGGNPLAPGPPPVMLVKNGDTVTWTYTRRNAALGEVNLQTEFTTDPAGLWNPVAGDSETILTDDGVLQNVKIVLSGSLSGQHFFRLRAVRK